VDIMSDSHRNERGPVRDPAESGRQPPEAVVARQLQASRAVDVGFAALCTWSLIRLVQGVSIVSGPVEDGLDIVSAGNRAATSGASGPVIESLLRFHALVMVAASLYVLFHGVLWINSHHRRRPWAAAWLATMVEGIEIGAYWMNGTAPRLTGAICLIAVISGWIAFAVGRIAIPNANRHPTPRQTNRAMQSGHPSNRPGNAQQPRNAQQVNNGRSGPHR
jgi:hypothetical protein